jgi:hypothetical protein
VSERAHESARVSERAHEREREGERGRERGSAPRVSNLAPLFLSQLKKEDMLSEGRLLKKAVRNRAASAAEKSRLVEIEKEAPVAKQVRGPQRERERERERERASASASERASASASERASARTRERRERERESASASERATDKKTTRSHRKQTSLTRAERPRSKNLDKSLARGKLSFCASTQRRSVFIFTRAVYMRVSDSAHVHAAGKGERIP